MAYCVRCGCKVNLLNSMIFNGENTVSICNKCIKELEVPKGYEVVYTKGTYAEFLALIRSRNPGLLESEPGKRKQTDFQTPPPMPDIPDAEEILDEKYLVTNPDIRLDAMEKCYLAENVSYNITTQKTKVIDRGYSTATFRTWSGVRYGVTTKNAPKVKRTEELKVVSGKLYLTSERIIFEIKDQYFTEFYENIRNIKFNVASFEISFDDDDILNIGTFSWGRIGFIIELITAMRRERAVKATERKTTRKKSAKSAGRKSENNDKQEAIKLIRQYKELYDDGIITKEEFETKKAELLKK